MADEDQELSDDDFNFDEMQLFRTDGLWYLQAHDVLSAFACHLKNTNLSDGLRNTLSKHLPDDICYHIGSFAHVENPVMGIERHRVAQRSSAYILAVLKARMESLQRRHPGCVHSEDPYMNVIKYFETLRPNFLEQQDDAYLLNHVLPWLGLTDWSSNSGSKGGTHGGHTHQMVNFKSKLRKYLIKRDQRIGLKRSAEPAAAEPAAAEPAAAEPAAEALSPRTLRARRSEHFGFTLTKGDKGGKRATTKKPRRVRKCKTVKKAKRRCKK